LTTKIPDSPANRQTVSWPPDRSGAIALCFNRTTG
jgi:hypothetical protein